MILDTVLQLREHFSFYCIAWHFCWIPVFHIYHCSSIFFPDSQIETDTVTKTDDRDDEWKSDYENINEPWEEEVEDLVAWTNTLNTDTLED